MKEYTFNHPNGYAADHTSETKKLLMQEGKDASAFALTLSKEMEQAKLL